jgi:hypothetical protein
MTEEELFELWKKMRKERVDENLRPPYEPSAMEFGKRVAEVAYKKGYKRGNTDGWLEGHKSGSTGPFGEPLA